MIQLQILTVAELTTYVKRLLDADEILQEVIVRGEISNYTKHSSGHLYFSLKDEQSQLSCVCFRRAAQTLSFAPEAGMQVVAGGNVTVYERGGRYQLIVRFMRPDGVGDLHAKLEALKQKLEAEGLFEVSRKRPLPRFPQGIALCTSSTGAAIQDLTSIIGRRYPLAKMVLFPTTVQGEEAAGSIINSLRAAEQREDIDVIIVGRGGGSLEDLWAFNEEAVARAIFASPKPVISAVGHETDFTVADFVADVRAATPSAAAELVVPEQRELLARLQASARQLQAGVRGKLRVQREVLQQLQQRPILVRPQRLLELWQQRVDDSGAEMSRHLQGLVGARRGRFEKSVVALAALSPRGVLGRGYAICRRERDGAVVASIESIRPGEQMTATVTDGEILSEVSALRPQEN